MPKKNRFRAKNARKRHFCAHSIATSSIADLSQFCAISALGALEASNQIEMAGGRRRTSPGVPKGRYSDRNQVNASKRSGQAHSEPLRHQRRPAQNRWQKDGVVAGREKYTGMRVARQPLMQIGFRRNTWIKLAALILLLCTGCQGPKGPRSS